MHKTASVWLTCSEYKSPKEFSKIVNIPNVVGRIHIPLCTIKLENNIRLEELISIVKEYSCTVQTKEVNLHAVEDKLHLDEKRICVKIQPNQDLQKVVDGLHKALKVDLEVSTKYFRFYFLLISLRLHHRLSYAKEMVHLVF